MNSLFQLSIVTHFLTGDALFNLSISYKQNGDWHIAILCARQALHVRQATLPLSHPNVAAVDRWIRVLKENVEADSSDEDDEEHITKELLLYFKIKMKYQKINFSILQI